MGVICHLSRLMGERRIKMAELARDTGMSPNTVFMLYHENAQGITFKVMDKLCRALECQPGDLLEYVPGEPTARKRRP